MTFDDYTDLSLEEQAARLVASDTDALAKRVAEMSGTSYSLSHLTPNTELWSWNFRDPDVDENQLIAAGMPPSEREAHLYPLRSKLKDQAGRTYDAQAQYETRMRERAMRAEAAGRVPKPPERQGGIHQAPFEPIKEED